MGILERQQTRVIDDVTYVVNPLPFGIGNKALLRFTRVVGAALASIKTGSSGVASMGAIVSGLSDDDVDYFAKTFGNASWYLDGEKSVPLVPVNQETHFDGRYEAFYGWLLLCIEVNFGSFLSRQLRNVGLDVSQVKAAMNSALAPKSGGLGDSSPTQA